MHEIRHVIARMRLGESDRDIARAGAMGRPKAAQLRALASEQGWLDLSQTLPPNDVLESLLQLPRSTQPSQSLAKPFADQICTWADEGIQITTTHQALAERYGFTGSYDFVKRFIWDNKTPTTVFFAHSPAIS